MAGSVRCSKAADPFSLSRDRLYCSDLSFLRGNQLRLKPSKARILMTLTLPRKISPGKRDEEFNVALPKPSTKEETIAKPVRKVPKGKQVTHSMPEEKKEIFKSLESWAESNILTYLKPVEKCWQASDFLPESSSEGFYDEVKELRQRSAGLPDEYLVCLVGNMITEEALPTYQSWINTLDGTRDESGADASSWAIWSRSWTAEENRHGDLLNKYLYLTGRVDNRKIEQTIQYLIGSGMDLQTENSPYLGFIYTSFQERATAISHGNTSRYAKQCGDSTLAAICGVIAADEKRHENAYTKIVSKLFELDPDYTMLSLEDMTRKKITMPAFLMYDGERTDVFESYSSVAQRAGVYTARDYANILAHLVSKWHVDKLTNLSPSAQRAQDYVCNLPARIMKLEERAQSKVKQGPHLGRFSWVFNREVALL